MESLVWAGSQLPGMAIPMVILLLVGWPDATVTACHKLSEVFPTLFYSVLFAVQSSTLDGELSTISTASRVLSRERKERRTNILTSTFPYIPFIHSLTHSIHQPYTLKQCNGLDYRFLS